MDELKIGYHFSGKFMIGHDISYKLTKDQKSLLKDTKKQILKSVGESKDLEGQILSDITKNETLFFRYTAEFPEITVYDLAINELQRECRIVNIGMKYHIPKTECEKLLAKQLKLSLNMIEDLKG